MSLKSLTNFIEIVDMDDPRVEIFRSLKDGFDRLEGLFIVDSEKVVQKVLKTDIELIKVLGPPEFYHRNEALLDQREIPVESRYLASRALLQQIVGYRLHKGAMALARKPANSSVEQLLEHSGDRDIVVVLNGVTEAENVGAICRNMAGFGVKRLMIDHQSCHPYLRRAVRVSMGNIFDLQLHDSADLLSSIKHLQASGYKVIAAETSEGAIELQDLEIPKKVALVLGSEGAGISKEILQQVDQTTIIPIAQKVVSFNVASTSAICLYHLSRSSAIIGSGGSDE